MGHGKLKKFAENETFDCLVQPRAEEILSQGYAHLTPHPLKGKWIEDKFHRPDGTPLILELGCGKGEYTLELARRNPDNCFIGVDIKGARLWRGAKTATEEGIGNAAFLRTRIEFIEAFFAEDEVDEIWLTFSDPQMKSENSRLTSPVFLERYSHFLRDGGVIHLKTDSRFLYEYTLALVGESEGLKLLRSTTDLYGTASTVASEVRQVQTFYEKMFLSMGVPITYLEFAMSKGASVRHPVGFDAQRWRSLEKDRRSFGHGVGK